MKIFGINFGDLFTQMSHAFSLFMGLATALGLFDAKTAAAITGAVGSVGNAVGTLASVGIPAINGALTVLHGLGWLGAVMGLVGWALHNSDQVLSLFNPPKPTLPAATAAPTAVK